MNANQVVKRSHMRHDKFIAGIVFLLATGLTGLQAQESAGTTGPLAGGQVTDADGNIYNTVQIGSQLWMAENLRTTKDKTGNAIKLVTHNGEWANLEDNDTDKAYCYYNNDESLGYGALYTFAAAKDACPTGWHLPDDAEWMELETYLANNGHSKTAGTALKSKSGWNSEGNGTDDYGFSALAGGYRSDDNGAFNSAGAMGYWWSNTDTQELYAWYRFLTSNYAGVTRYGMGKSSGYSVRCVKDN